MFPTFRCEVLEPRTLLSLILANNPPLTTSDAGGPVLADPHVALIFWGAGWNASASPTSTQVRNSAETIATGTYTRDLASYRPVFASGGSIYNAYFITSSSPPANFVDDDMRAMLQANIAAGVLPRVTTDNHLFYMVIPQAGSTDPTEGFGGFHSYNDDDQNNRYYYGWTINNGSLDTIDWYFSHELVEVMTDPDGRAIQVEPRNPDNWNEISDGSAAFIYARLNGYLVQSYWLQSKNAYVVGTGVQDVSNLGGHLVINGDQLTNKDDTITVTDDAFGGVTVAINNESMGLLAGSVNDITVNGLSGNDQIQIATTIPMTVNGGVGTDTIFFDRTGTSAVLLPSSGDDAVFVHTNTATGSSVVTINATQRIGTLHVGAGGQLIVSPGGAKVLTTTGIILPVGGIIDLNDNDLIVDYPVGTASPRAEIQNAINTARTGGTWTGTGLKSTSAGIANPRNTTLGVLEATEFKSIYGPTAAFDAQPIDTSAVLVKYTYYGDTDFNGVVNFDDYSRTDSGFNLHKTGWLNGDFDGNGQVDFDDYSLIDLAFNTQSGTLRPVQLAPRKLPKSKPV